jgi:hypothetical protein
MTRIKKNEIREIRGQERRGEKSDEMSEPQDFASEAITELEAVVDDLPDIVALLEKEEGIAV